jgi:hypothetical protein
MAPCAVAAVRIGIVSSPDLCVLFIYLFYLIYLLPLLSQVGVNHHAACLVTAHAICGPLSVVENT